MRTKVLIVEDHFLFAEALGSVIRDLPRFELVGIAVTGPQALSLAQSERPELVLLDFHLPGYSADQLAPRIKAAAPGARIIILTSDTSEQSMVKGVQAGADGYLTKDRALDDVVQILTEVSEGRSALTAEQVGVAAAAVQPDSTLTQREIEILRLLGDGRDNAAIAAAFTISANTVRTHLQNIFTKLDAHSKLEAVAVATRRGLLR